jgi:uncharacterized membrane protein YphA (DoxX/SURF4 family)
MTAASAFGVPPHTSVNRPERWNLVEKIGFRLIFAYLILYCWPSAGRASLVDALPFDTGLFSEWAAAPMRALCPWVAVHVFHLSGAVTQYHPTGSGDTTLDYVQVFCFGVIASFAALVWSVLDRGRENYHTLHAWLRAIVRLTLAVTMLSYGVAKVLALQMPTPSLSTLTETFGQASPMRLLWTFMGASQPYERFTGLVEMSAGLLLLFPRTVTLGACAAAAAMVNVVMLNFCYDVPVKLYSSHLLLMSLFLLLPDAAALGRFFVLRRAAEPREIRIPKFRRRGLRIAAAVFNAALVLSILYENTWDSYQSQKDYVAEFNRHPPLYGVWAVDSITGESLHWRTLVVDSAAVVVTGAENDEVVAFNVKTDESKRHWKMTGRRSRHKGDLDYSQPDEQHLVLTGNIDGIGLQAQLHRLPASQFLLTSRGFHWINEDPFNR